MAVEYVRRVCQWLSSSMIRLFRYGGFLLIALLPGIQPLCSGQLCQHDTVNLEHVILQVEQAAHRDTDKESYADQRKHSEIIYRAGAVAGEAITPTLIKLAKPGLAADSVPGAAQTSLAKLGDRHAFDQLVTELNKTRVPDFAVEKLIRVGNDEAISALMTYYLGHLNDPSLYQDYGDYSTNLLADITEGLAAHLDVGPQFKNGAFRTSGRDYIEWWQKNQRQPIMWSISVGLHDPYSACLARKVEWGFPDAIFDMGNTSDPELNPVLRKLEGIGPQALVDRMNQYTIHGLAMVALARRREDGAFEELVRLSDIGEDGASKALTLVGGRRAVDALMESLDNKHFMEDDPGLNWPDKKAVAREKELITRYAKVKDASVISLISDMIIDSPDFQGSLVEQKSQWRAWWKTHRDTAQFVVPKTYE